VDLSSVLIAVAGVAGTLGASTLTLRGSERAKLRELELIRSEDHRRENHLLRRTCYIELNQAARYFTTAINRHLHVLQERETTDEDLAMLDEAKAAERDRYSEAQMIASDDVLERAQVVNHALSHAYGRVRRLERNQPRKGETLGSAADAQEAIWGLLRDMRTTMRNELGVAPRS
jgi:hypothetical protein